MQVLGKGAAGVAGCWRARGEGGHKRGVGGNWGCMTCFLDPASATLSCWLDKLWELQLAANGLLLPTEYCCVHCRSDAQQGTGVTQLNVVIRFSGALPHCPFLCMARHLKELESQALC